MMQNNNKINYIKSDREKRNRVISLSLVQTHISMEKLMNPNKCPSHGATILLYFIAFSCPPLSYFCFCCCLENCSYFSFARYLAAFVLRTTVFDRFFAVLAKFLIASF